MKKQLLLLVLILLPMVASAYDIAVENAEGITIYYSYINNGTELQVTYKSWSAHQSTLGSKYTYTYYGYEGVTDLVIPEEATYLGRTRKVTSIGSNAFKGCGNLKSVTIPNSVTYIGNSFEGCTGLSSVVIGDNVKNIDSSAFKNCTALTSIAIPNSVTSIGKEAFKDCSGLNKVIVSDIALWCGIIFDSPDANPLLYANHLYSDEQTEILDLVIPNSVTSIGNYAFHDCSALTSVTIGSSVTSIGSKAFNHCSGLKKVIISDIAAWCGIKFDISDPNPLFYANHLYSDEQTEIQDLVIPNNVTSIGNYAFGYCYGLTSVIIPNSVKNIGEYAFYNCSALTSVTIGSGVTGIGRNAFDGANIPTVISLKENPFAIKGRSLYERTFSQNTFYNATLYVPMGTIDKYKATSGWKDFVFIEESNPAGISVVENTKNNNTTIFDLNGVRLPKAKKGINIVNGKKVVLK